MKVVNLNVFKTEMEKELRNLLTLSYKKAQSLPEIMQGLMIMKAAGEFCESVKNDYPRIKRELEKTNQSIGLNESEYRNVVDDVTSKVLGEFVEIPNSPPHIDPSYYD